jgi:hypothetical protein
VDVLCDPILKISYLVIDAVDECLTHRVELLDLIVSEVSDTKVKWIVSSCNWSDMEENLVRAGHQVLLSLRLNSKLVAAAINLFLRKDHKDHDANTAVEVAEHMASNAGDTFL